ncbi:hypothetical protein [Paraburkholderia caribensis]|uniref:hypothetical protein n=1 Tax=Paraburkholderia caribensis TaxID=75105 RepID=UPI001D05CD1A|nr:hypothetical protein [Paraburkholderia caribensis]
MTAFVLSDASLMKAVVGELLKTERNGILTKNQTTVELAKAKAEQEASKDLSGTLVKVLESVVAARKGEHPD